MQTITNKQVFINVQAMCKLLLVLFGLSVFSASTHAKTDSIGYDTGIVGIKGGTLIVSDNIAKTIDNPINYGAYFGYKFNKKFGVELDYTTSKTANVTNLNKETGTYSVATYGTYLTYNYPINDTSVYAKAKIGVGGAEIDERYGSVGKSSDDVGVSGGLGLGVHIFSNVALETEFNMLKTDNMNINMVTLGTHFSF